MKIPNPFKLITNTYNKLSTWGKILLFILLLLIVVSFMKVLKPKREGFQQMENLLVKKDNAVFDNFYASVYDDLVFNNIKDEYEIGEIVNQLEPTEKSIIVDIGSGTGHHVAKLASRGYKNVQGVDSSEAMVKKSKEMYPDQKYTVGDATNPSLFKPESVTHILCFYFTIYYIKDKNQFFRNCINWLMPGGYLVVHIVDREMFDPILPPGNPLVVISPQRYAKERITHTKVSFDDMDYYSNFALDSQNNMAKFEEKFTNREDGKVRKNEQTLYMESEADINNMAQNAGFILQGKIDLINCYYEYQYLYIFQKPE